MNRTNQRDCPFAWIPSCSVRPRFPIGLLGGRKRTSWHVLVEESPLCFFYQIQTSPVSSSEHSPAASACCSYLRQAALAGQARFRGHGSETWGLINIPFGPQFCPWVTFPMCLTHLIFFPRGFPTNGHPMFMGAFKEPPT